MNKLIKISAVSVLTVLAVVAFSAPFAMAQPTEFTPEAPPSVDIVEFGGLVDILANLVNWMYMIFFIAAAGFILYSAFLYLTAGGSEERLKKAKTGLLYAVIAIVVALVAFGIDNLVASLIRG